MQLNHYLDIKPEPFMMTEATIKGGKVSVWFAKEVEGGVINFEEFKISTDQGGEFEKVLELDKFASNDYIQVGFSALQPANCCWPEGLVAYASVNRKGSIKLTLA